MTLDDTNWPTIAKNVGYGVAFFVAMLLVMVLFAPQVPEQRWAVIDEDEVHAAWDSDSQTVQISLDIQKRQECSRVIVDKTLRPIEKNDVQTRAIPLEGKLSEKIQRVPVGSSVTLFDIATPRTPIVAGHYLLTLAALCELPAQPDDKTATAVVPITPTTVTTVPVRVVLVVSSLDNSLAHRRPATMVRYRER